MWELPSKAIGAEEIVQGTSERRAENRGKNRDPRASIPCLAGGKVWGTERESDAAPVLDKRAVQSVRATVTDHLNRIW